jgi:Pyruvate/2-oxoacid:ferredoxin oxidoreductase delta subunit
MGTRPKWYLTILAKIWKLLYIKPSVPILGKLIYKVRVDGTTSETLNISYLPINIELEVESSPLPIIILESIIRSSEHRVITHRCTCRDAWKCKNFDLHIGCMHIGAATAEEDTTVAHHATIEEAIAHLHNAVNAGLVPFVGHVAADNTIWNVSPNRPFVTVCFCCPCCCTQFDYYRYLPPKAKGTIHPLKGVTVAVDEHKCIGCGKCAEVCLTGAAALREGKSHIDEKVCKTCGVCALACRQKAITVRVENIENTVNELLGRIDKDVGGLAVKEYA